MSATSSTPASGPPAPVSSRQGSAAAGTSTPALSPSRAADFTQCALLYRFRVLDRLPEQPTAAQARGTLVHAVLERLFDQPAAERTMEKAIDLLAPAWADLSASTPELAIIEEHHGGDERWLATTHPLLKAYFRLEDPTRLDPAGRELRVETVLATGVPMRGFIDRLDVSTEGLIRVVDYKTGKSPDPRFEGSALFQMKFYALLIRNTRGTMPRLLQLLYLGDERVLRYEPTDRDLAGVERKATALWSAILRAAERDEWQERTSALCRWCAHQALCPAFGGVTPPTPEDRRDWLLSSRPTTSGTDPAS